MFTCQYIVCLLYKLLSVFLIEVTDKFTESMYVLANEPSVALYRLQEHVRRSLPELVQHKVDMKGIINNIVFSCERKARKMRLKMFAILRTCFIFALKSWDFYAVI